MNNLSVGDYISLQKEDLEIVRCEECSHLMVNVDEVDLRPGDFNVLKRKGIRVSNPDTTDEICSHCEEPRSHVSSWWDDNDDDDDSNFFNMRTSTPSLSSMFSFGGGKFSGGGASRKF